MKVDYKDMIITLRSYLEQNGVSRDDTDNVVDGVLNDLAEAIEELGGGNRE